MPSGSAPSATLNLTDDKSGPKPIEAMGTTSIAEIPVFLRNRYFDEAAITARWLVQQSSPQSRPPYLFGLPRVILIGQAVTPEQAFDQYHQAVFRFLYRLTRRPDVAEDLTQESFLVFLRTPGRFDAARGSIRTFLFAIARNLALKQFRDYGAEEQWEEGSDLTSAPDPRPGIEIGAAVAEAVATLAPLQREALILFEYEGLTLEEVAAVVAADVGTVKSRLHRARATLKRALAPYRNKGRILHGTV